MSDPIVAVQAAGQIAARQNAVTMDAAMRTPDAKAVDQFQAAMGTQQVQDIPFAHQISETWGAAKTSHQQLLHRITALNELKLQHGPSVIDLMELQYDVANLSFLQEVVTDVAKKSSDAVQTLIKNG